MLSNTNTDCTNKNIENLQYHLRKKLKINLKKTSKFFKSQQLTYT